MTCHRGPEKGGFKTPSLREVSRTAPYFHDGSVASLEEVVDHYTLGGNASAPSDIHPLELKADEKAALVAFLRALSSSPDRFVNGPNPTSPPPG